MCACIRDAVLCPHPHPHPTHPTVHTHNNACLRLCVDTALYEVRLADLTQTNLSFMYSIPCNTLSTHSIPYGLCPTDRTWTGGHDSRRG